MERIKVKGSLYTKFFIIFFILFLISILNLFFILVPLSKFKRYFLRYEVERALNINKNMLELKKSSINNLISSYYMWTNMYIRAKKRDVPWLEEMFDDSLVHSTSDSYGVFSEEGKLVYGKDVIFNDADVKKIIDLIKEKFEIGKEAYPFNFYHKLKDNVYLVGVLPLCDDRNLVQSYDFGYFAFKLGKSFIENLSALTGTRITVDTIMRSNNPSIPLKDFNGGIISFLRLEPQKDVIKIIRNITDYQILFSLLIFLILILGSMYIFYTSRRIPKRLSYILKSINALSKGEWDEDGIKKAIEGDDEISLLAKNLKNIAQDLSNLIIKDYLTQAYNSYYFSRTLEKEIERAKRYNQPLSFIYLDFYNFKYINDAYGHDIGDKVLKEFSQKISSKIRSIDTFARLGGDEFGIIMPETDIEGAMYVARKILKIAEEEPLQIDKNTIKFSVSIGITQLKEGDDKNTIIKRADRAMYLAKDKGSNKTKVLI